MSDHSFFEHLFEYSKQVTPYLDGQLAPLATSDPSLIHLGHPSSQSIRELYVSLEKEHPEAGAPYWLTRSWTLLCWQPIYVAFISIYACRGLPDLTKMAQKVHPRFISGFQFESSDFSQGTESELIEQAGKQLVELFEYFRNEMSQWTRIRPGFTRHLFADSILGCIVKLHQLAPALDEEYLMQQARLWLHACRLPEKLLSSLSYDPHSNSLKLFRTSCCLVYKCHGRQLCSDCPRHPANKR